MTQRANPMISDGSNSRAGETLRDRALRAIGRNLVNLQRLEYCIKYLSRFSPVEGPMSTIVDGLNRRVEQISKRTLGQALADLRRSGHANDAIAPKTPDLFDVWIRHTFEFGLDTEVLREHLRCVSKLVSDRNDLVHHRFVSVNFDSEEECLAVVKELDSQNEAILDHLATLGALAKGVRDLLAEYSTSLELAVSSPLEREGDS